MKKIFLYAYDKVNLGDDLFINSITKRYPNVIFYLWTDARNRVTFQNIPNLKILDKDSMFLRCLQRIRPSFVARYKNWREKRCDASVYIGGSIFMEYETWRNQIAWLDYQAEKRNFFVIGANFGPYRTEAYREQLDNEFLKMRDVCFRDRYSLNKFDGNPNVRYAPDILFAYSMPQVDVKEKQIFVSIINCVDRDETHSIDVFDRNYVENMARILCRYLEDGCRLVLASFCSVEGDEQAIHKVISAMNCAGDSRIKVVAYDGTNAELMIRIIAESDYIIASRFHAMILAMTAGRPVLPIIYSDKTKHVLDDLEFKGVIFDLRKEKSWDYALSRKNWDQPVELLMKKYKSAAQEHFEKIDELLQK